MNTKERIMELLRSTNRENIAELIEYLEQEGFFESPASTRYHGAYLGGLAAHSLRVFELLKAYHNQLDLTTVSAPGQKPLPVEYDNLVIAGLLHDVCKVGAYIGTEKPYTWNKGQPKGHATLSLKRIKRFIKLTEIEEMMIRYHMGPYGANEFEQYCGEYPLGTFDDIAEDVFLAPEYSLLGDHSEENLMRLARAMGWQPLKKKMSKEESQKARYGQSLRNAWYHNLICKVMYFCDELATLEERDGANIK